MAFSNAHVGDKSVPVIPDKETLLQQTYLEAFQANYDSVQKWTRWKEDHEQLKATLSTLPYRLSHDVVIPFGSKALMKAKLVHTNEVTTCLGDKWFVKQSCKQAIDMCSRRIKQSEEMLKMLEKEQTLLCNRQILPKLEEAFPSNDAQEIIEDYDERREAEWRVQHRQREREFRQKLAQLRKQQEGRAPPQNDEDLFRRLDELELEEELNDELERLHAEYEEHCKEEGRCSSEESDGNDESSDDEDEKELALKKDCNVRNPSQLDGVGETDSHMLNSTTDEEVETEKLPSKVQKLDHEVPSPSKSNKTRRLTFADDLCTEPSHPNEIQYADIYIKFKHSVQPSPPPKHYDDLNNASSRQEIHSPSDIYDYHKALSIVSHPKSILKSRQPLTEENKESPISPSTQPFGSTLGLSFSDAEEEDNAICPRDLSHLPPVLCDVKEKTPLEQQLKSQPHERKTQRPVSLFKAARQGARK